MFFIWVLTCVWFFSIISLILTNEGLFRMSSCNSHGIPVFNVISGSGRMYRWLKNSSNCVWDVNTEGLWVFTSFAPSCAKPHGLYEEKIFQELSFEWLHCFSVFWEVASSAKLIRHWAVCCGAAKLEILSMSHLCSFISLRPRSTGRAQAKRSQLSKTQAVTNCAWIAALWRYFLWAMWTFAPLNYFVLHSCVFLSSGYPLQHSQGSANNDRFEAFVNQITWISLLWWVRAAGVDS